jgi:Vacuolar sorting-associated protein 13, N-terminal
MKGLITKVIDNLQVAIHNVHVRIENEDLEDKQCTFSLGATLQQLTFHTTDQLWNK